MIAVIQAAAQMSGWVYGPRAANIGSGRYRTGTGTSAVHYEGSLGYNAAVVKLTVDTKTGKVKVDHVWSAQDCGPAINPDGQKQQAEGCVMQGISRSLFEEVTFDKAMVTSLDWSSYPILDLADAPDAIDIVLINRPEVPPSGAGESSIRPVAAALANAIFDATGVRVRRAPLTPERVKAAIG